MSAAPRNDNDRADDFLRASTAARAAIDAARVTQESVRETRCRLRLQAMIVPWRRRRATDAAVQAERLALILDAVCNEAAAPMGNIQLFERGALRIRTAAGLNAAFLAHFAEVLPGCCPCGTAHHTGGAVVVDDVRTSALYRERDRDMMLRSEILACQSLALVRAGRRLGAISVHYPEAGIPLRRQSALVALSADISEAVSLAVCEAPGPARQG